MGVVQTWRQGEANSWRRRVRKSGESLQETAPEGYTGLCIQTGELHLSVRPLLCQLWIQVEAESPIFIATARQYLQGTVDIWERADSRG